MRLPFFPLLLCLAALACHAADAEAPAEAQVELQSYAATGEAVAAVEIAQPAAPLAFSQRPEVRAFIEEMASQHGFDAAALTLQFDQVVEKPSILAILDRPSTSRPYYAFRPNFVNDQRIRLGVAWWREHAALLDAVSARYGVEPEYLVAILGVETMWGRNTGTFRVMDALSTVAFGYPRRAEFFRKELREFLLLARDEGVSPFSFRGSYAGAMGMPQFMPSSFHAYAQDWNGDGRHDIWNDTGDILASIAHYFVQHGWQAGRPLVVPAAVEGDAYGPLVEDKFNLHYRVSELAAFGVRPAAPLAGDPLAVLAPLEGAPGVTNYWLGLGNFYAITRYNRSTLYAMAVHELAMATKAAYLDPSLLPPEPKPARKAKPQRAKPNKGKAKPAAVHKGKKK
ncbi:lytic murein transglycosylase B [Chitinimonas koreensis]|uniref:lytic murein transglycosylase B n=1 Tax=Chitinimonas koreensis TaxID=356302 RepID=UPI0003F54E87|nr:lytic murein transglycosylase B [Chitinimonas koreensis]